jgi:hypothetical protein
MPAAHQTPGLAQQGETPLELAPGGYYQGQRDAPVDDDVLEPGPPAEVDCGFEVPLRLVQSTPFTPVLRCVLGYLH